MYASLGVTCHLHFWQNDRGLLRNTAVTGVERTPNESQHTKLTLEKKILPPLLPGLELETFPSRVRRSYQPAIPTATTELNIPYNVFVKLPDMAVQVVFSLAIKYLNLVSEDAECTKRAIHMHATTFLTASALH